MLATDKAPLTIARMAVRVVRRLAEGADVARRFVPAQDAVVRDIAPQQIAAVAEPDRPLRPARALIQTLDGSGSKDQRLEARIEHTDGRIGIASAVVGHAG